MQEASRIHEVASVERPRQSPQPRQGVALQLIEVDRLVKAAEARARFRVSGSGLAVAVLDTGLNSLHVDFAERVWAQKNFTADNGGRQDDGTDGHGHGTNVAGIICANGDHTGVAPNAAVIPVKVLSNTGGGSFTAIEDGLQWVLDAADAHRISAICMSLGDGGNYQIDTRFASHSLRTHLLALRERRIAVCIAAGNDYFRHGSQQGMGYPAILRDSISVGAVYDNIEGSFAYRDGAVAHSTAPDRITPFSQRLHESLGAACRTDIFAPGAPVTSSGITGPHGESIQHGTSQATPVLTGVVLMVQELYLRATNELPDIDTLVSCLRNGAVRIHDGDDEHDNVTHTRCEFRRVDAVGALSAVQRHLELRALSAA
jgi:subtilisin family serine protease